jgi:hypothetical protein
MITLTGLLQSGMEGSRELVKPIHTLPLWQAMSPAKARANTRPPLQLQIGDAMKDLLNGDVKTISHQFKHNNQTVAQRALDRAASAGFANSMTTSING